VLADYVRDIVYAEVDVPECHELYAKLDTHQTRGVDHINNTLFIL
jgi:hypothetical protein